MQIKKSEGKSCDTKCEEKEKLEYNECFTIQRDN
jgi:hypothetical protein